MPTQPANDEGYIKFDCVWSMAPALSAGRTRELREWRDRLFEMGLVGVYPDGIGYGNVSVRDGDGFIITGTQTGSFEHLPPDGVTAVVEYDIARNRVVCHGPVKASSESMTHAAIYRLDRSIGAVVHVHDLATWQATIGILPTSRADVPYGTPEMAMEIERLYREDSLAERRVAVMAGHREGLIAFGPTLASAVEVVVGCR